VQDFNKERQAMVEEQLQKRGIIDPAVLRTMAKIPRHSFVSSKHQSAAYEDCPLSIGENQTISQPYMVAIMTQSLETNGEERVLEIGTGSGYQTAILAELAKKVFTIERIPELIRKAQEVLGKLDYQNIHFLLGDGSRGWPEHAPFDGIMVTAGAPEIPETLKSQLADGGKMVVPVGSRFSQMLYKVTRKGSRFIEEDITGCVFVPLLGEYGWKEE
jgi:protein-L-isoaspartate(D-aspartate) O-methyltransferase